MSHLCMALGGRSVVCSVLVSFVVVLFSGGRANGEVGVGEVGGDRVRPAVAEGVVEVGPYDELVGWYKIVGPKRAGATDGGGLKESYSGEEVELADGDLIVGVLKRGGEYFSVCFGMEIPFSAGEKGLEWGKEDSSMRGTTIWYDEAAGIYRLDIIDRVALYHRDNDYEEGQEPPDRRVLVPIDTPEWLEVGDAAMPGKMDEFVGKYRPVYISSIRFDLRKQGDAYVVETEAWDKDGWRGEGKAAELKPLADGSGFSGFEGREEWKLVYDKSMKRFELAMEHKTGKACMPLVKLDLSADAERGEADLPKVVVGIPAWR